jgi:thiamine biosynthesis lipoprotein
MITLSCVTRARAAMHSLMQQFFALGSDCALHIEAGSVQQGEEAARAAIAEIARIEARYSRYRTDSELSRINAVAARGGRVEVDAETAGLINYAWESFRKSDGLFDITSGILRRAWSFPSGRLPEETTIAALLARIGLEKLVWEEPRLSFPVAGVEIDFGGIGKEYAADRAASVCRAMGIRHGFVDLGGDIRLLGGRSDGGRWRIGIRHPRSPSTAMAVVSLDSGAVATSGDYERFIESDGKRYCHILNPRTGWPVNGLRSVTVIADDCLVAGTLATIAMLKGRSAIAWLRSIGVRHVAMDEDGHVDGTEPCEPDVTPTN